MGSVGILHRGRGVGPQNPSRKRVLRIRENAQMVKEKKFLPDFHMEKLPVFFIRL